MPFVGYEPIPFEQRCMSREHDPPTNIVLSDGTHTWKCPSCGKETVVIVSNPRLCSNVPAETHGQLNPVSAFEKYADLPCVDSVVLPDSLFHPKGSTACQTDL